MAAISYQGADNVSRVFLERSRSHHLLVSPFVLTWHLLSRANKVYELRDVIGVKIVGATKYWTMCSNL